VKSATHCQLLLPGMLLEAGTVRQDAPALNTMLRHATHLPGFAGGRDAWLCRFFGVERQQDWPVAPFSCVGEGLDPGTGYWICADPVHLQLQRGHFSVIADAFKAIDLEQVRQLTDTLNENFSPDGMRFSAPRVDRWYLHVEAPPNLGTCSLSEAMGQNAISSMFQGGDALQWRARLNEIQMLLHDHPVNLELEKRGGLPMNSLWLWGGGVLPARVERNAVAVWALDPLTRGLAKNHGATVAQLPASAGEWLENGLQQSTHLIDFGCPKFADQHNDPRELIEVMKRFEGLWFTPLLQSLWHGRLARISLHFATAQRVESYSLTRADMWKFWRRFWPVGARFG
jgi:hypothetical protein